MISLTIPLPAKISANAFYAGLHWAKRAKIAHEFHQAVWVAARSRHLKPTRVTDYPVELSFGFLLGGRLLDVSNLFAMAKLLEDGLRLADVIKDDGPKYVQAVSLWQAKVPGTTNSCTIVISSFEKRRAEEQYYFQLHNLGQTPHVVAPWPLLVGLMRELVAPRQSDGFHTAKATIWCWFFTGFIHRLGSTIQQGERPAFHVEPVFPLVADEAT